MNLALPVYQFLSAATGGAKDGQLDIHTLPGIRTRDLCFSSRIPEQLHRRSASVERKTENCLPNKCMDFSKVNINDKL